MEVATSCFRHIEAIFTELDECRAFELLRSSYDRGNFLLSKHAKVSARSVRDRREIEARSGRVCEAGCRC
eukprot:1902832-Pleurochrysis_carterae.AAC.1